jgi:hypothetical protein
VTDLFGLIVADTHAFHECGLTPPNFLLSTGNIVQHNPAQDYLWQCWWHIIEQLPERIDFLILNGDLGEGKQPAEHGRGVQEPEPLFQARGVANLLTPVVSRMPVLPDGSRRILMQRGTRYHTGRGGAIEELVGEKLKARQNEATNRYTENWRQFCVRGVHFDCAHRQSGGENTAAVLNAEVDRMYKRFARTRTPVPEQIVLVRSHTHMGYCCVRRQGVTAISTPALKIMEDYAKGGISPNRWVPENLGAVGLRISAAENVEVIPYLYDHPQEEVEELFPDAG